MGADGHIVIAKREDFERENPGIQPSDLGLYTGKVLGIDACWGYYGDNLFEPNYGTEWDMKERFIPEGDDGPTFVPYTQTEREALERALSWFNGHAESHEVWT